MRIVFALAATLALASCGAKQTPRVLKIDIPTPPTMLPDSLKGDFVAQHYWDNLDFADTAYIDKEVTLQTFSNYAYLLLNMPKPMADRSLETTMNKARADSTMYAYFATMAENHFYQANSPYGSDELYAIVLRNIIAWDKVDELHKVRPREQLDVLMRNRVGDPAAEFAMTTFEGKTIDLKDIRADYVLLYFNQPKCPICAQLTEALLASDLVTRMVESGKMKIVAVYTGQYVDEWRTNIDEVPARWTRACAPVVSDENLYDLRVLPSLYLLDRARRVLIKDAVYAEQVELYFENN